MSQPHGHWVEDETPPVTLLDVRVPAKWDGIALEWYGWEPPVTGFLCANNDLLKWTPCPKCGHEWMPFTNRAVERDMWRRFQRTRLHIVLERCGFCGYTLATSRFDDGEPREWVLDETDYDEKGSVES